MSKATAKSTSRPDASGTRATSDQMRDHTESRVQSSDHGTAMGETSVHPTTAVWQRDPDLTQSDHNMTQDSIINDSGFIPSTPPAKKVSIMFPGGVSLGLALFPGGVSLGLALFPGGVSLGLALFPGGVSLGLASFPGGVSLGLASFSLVPRRDQPGFSFVPRRGEPGFSFVPRRDEPGFSLVPRRGEPGV